MLAALLALAAPAAAQTSVNETERATVRVAVIAESAGGRQLYGTGSGFMVAPNLAVTNAHVVAAARQQPTFRVTIISPEGDTMLEARIVRYSALMDLALLEFRGGPDVPAAMISTLPPHAGDPIIALGYPDVDDLQRPTEELVRPTPPSRTTGSIASLRDRAPTGDPIETINHEAAISSGSSGGPLLDECGRVIGVNTWHTRGLNTGEGRGVATRTGQLIEFLEEAGVAPRLTDERCLSFAERAESERAATIAALEKQNRELASKLETADRLTRIAVVILLGGTLALFVAVGVLGAILLRRPPPAPVVDLTAPYAQPAPPPPRRSALGVAAVIGGSVVAALIVVAAGIAFLQFRAPEPAPELAAVFDGRVACTLNQAASRNPGESEDMQFTVMGQMCVNGRTQYAPSGAGPSWRRVLLSGGERALDVLSLDPASGEFRRERYTLSPAAFAAAAEAAGAAGASGCGGGDVQAAVTARNGALMRFAQGEPEQRLVWTCRKAED